MNKLLTRAHYVPILVLLVYCGILALLTIPVVQRELLFLHHVTMPLFPDYRNPQKYGLGPFKTRNLRLSTADGEEIGAWHILPRSSYKSLVPFPPQRPLSGDVFDKALGERPTVLYFHGNAGTRAVTHRVRSYSAFSNSLDCNVVAIDYRGFGDSTGTPSEQGLLRDARTAYDFLEHTMRRTGFTKEETAKNVILAGQSLGTGVVSGLAGQLENEGIRPRALVLIAPFTSITELLTSYRILHAIPILKPLNAIPPIQRYFQSFLAHPFDSITALKNTSSPTLILHSIDDDIIPYSQSARVFLSILASASLKSESIEETKYGRWGTIRSFKRSEGGEVVWWEGGNGGHNALGFAEGTIDLIARIADL
ncbi:uncharacterized protein IL334_007785 [Kwoniella shivajii]|uniref:Serine aminopeptidase S33 domain-containing protein n=1 Tax=Kwoniella shivajii TaxID=564305 RepID=A0ABZ1DAF0_9TREE|nr:hypothetical protein IL334_007785 [Kwoniella shivajii]